MAESQKKAKDAPAQTAPQGGGSAVPETEKAAALAGKPAGGGDGKAPQGNREAVYTAEEIAANAEALFHVRPECVQAAFREKGIRECTKPAAKKAVKEFMEREVE